MNMASEAAQETLAQNVKLAKIVEHMRNNNIAYLIGIYVGWQMGLLDKVVTYGSGVCS